MSSSLPTPSSAATAATAVATNILRRTISKRVIVHWFRHTDLRVHDNHALTHSSTLSTDNSHPLSSGTYPVLPIFIFDDKIFGTHNRTPAGSLKCGVRRAKFIIESVQDLRKQIQDQIGSQLLVGFGDPYDIMDTVLSNLKKYYLQREVAYNPIIDKHYKNNIKLDLEIVCQKEYTTEEREAIIDMTHLLHTYNRDTTKEIQEIWGSTLYNQRRAPFDRICRLMPNDCRKVIVRLTKKGKMDLDKILPVPEILPYPPNFDCQQMTQYIPTLQELGYTDTEIATELDTIHDPRNDNVFVGGETVALQRCTDYIWTKDLLRDYKIRRKQASIIDQQTSKLSPYLAHGCISPRYIACEAKRACEIKMSKAHYHLYMAMINWELLQRDYCKFYTVKHGKYIFLKEGPVRPKRLSTRRLVNRRDPKLFDAWCNGQTGYPLIDAAMRELKTTGWINNRCRLYVASFLFADLDYDWTRGADWFESYCIDYDVYGNWVNWCMSTGLNTGVQYLKYVPKIEGRKYDPEGIYVKKWVPELKDVPKLWIHIPWKMNEQLQDQYNVRIGIDYPHPIVDPSIGDAKRKRRYLRKVGKLGYIEDGQDPNATKEKDDSNTEEEENEDDDRNRTVSSKDVIEQRNTGTDLYGERRSSTNNKNSTGKETSIRKTSPSSKWRVDLSTFDNDDDNHNDDNSKSDNLDTNDPKHFSTFTNG